MSTQPGPHSPRTRPSASQRLDRRTGAAGNDIDLFDDNNRLFRAAIRKSIGEDFGGAGIRPGRFSGRPARLWILCAPTRGAVGGVTGRGTRKCSKCIETGSSEVTALASLFGSIFRTPTSL
ncbi:hypothetical protein EVAR_24896_1 [Eumeta japonica]|uniref:Uncharacterized protein n=1 Tax=Eumeta variegata TaxID=151549 RepID=A0A4C1V6R3_EUMVA|nr:hypothetical protein EVAR_24896_1 [Eumeta japonica]